MTNIQPSPPIVIDLESDNLYEILGCSPGDNTAKIRKAYRKLATRFHPDHGGNRDTFQKIKRAYEILSDPEQREFYDNTGGVKPAKHDIESKAKETAIGVLTSVIEQAARGVQSMENSNLAKLAAQAIENNISNFRQNKAESLRVRSRYETALKRLKRNGQDTAASPVGVVIAQKIEQEKRKFSGMGIDIQVLEMALDIVRSYSYEVDPVADPFARKPGYFSAAGLGMEFMSMQDWGPR